MTSNTTTRKSKSAHPGTVWKKDIEAKGLSRLQVAKAMGVAPMSLHRVCEGEGIPTAEMTVRYARATGQEEATVWEAVQAYALQVALSKVPALDVAVPKEKAPAKEKATPAKSTAKSTAKKATPAKSTPAKEKAPAKSRAKSPAKSTPAKSTPARGRGKTGNPKEDQAQGQDTPTTKEGTLRAIQGILEG